uniref:Reverse transcriptase domain-containing protein n=1 Tax=Cannabis sativa TaxID=3483 RepID=A0A803NXV2_CANSA
MDCVTTAEYGFLVNGRPRGSVIPSRGLRQGCPLSPYLFLFCAEALSSLLRQAEVSGELMGFRCSRSGPRVSHLFFADDSLIFGRANGREAESIRRILQCYEYASGQQVNFDKSAITFSPNVLPADRTSVLGILGLGSVATHDKYLGLPTVIGRNKKRTFASICDKVQKRIRGWKRSFFSAGGREILIKAILQAVPNYMMSMFQLPVATCDKLRSIILQFWWGTNNDKRKIAWVKWEDVCQPKSKGGLGFKDLVLFNQAMVAKQVWRLMQSPHSLAARVLKYKYFPNTSILDAKDRQGSSHLWSSLIWGLKLLHLGLRKVVGDGQSVDAFRDPWIPRPVSFRPISPAPIDGVMVSELIGSEGTWDVQTLSQYFLSLDIDVILGIPLRGGQCEDGWCWHYNSNGCYSVKSGYKVAIDREAWEEFCGVSYGGGLGASLGVWVGEVVAGGDGTGMDGLVSGEPERCRWWPPGWGVCVIWWMLSPWERFYGLGGVIRGHAGEVWAAWAVGVVGDFQVAVAELLAVRMGLLWTTRLGFAVVRVETDSSVVSSWINCLDNILMYKPIIDEILSLLAAAGGGSCYAISRDANGVAHALAKSVTSSIGVQVWTDACPRFISAPVTVDLI